MCDLYPSIADIFDAPPTVLGQLPDEAPPQMPRIMLASKAEDWKCEIAPAQISVSWRRVDPTSETRQDLVSFFARCAELLSQYAKMTGFRIGRLAGLVTRLAERDDPGIYLARHFCKDKWKQAPLNRPENLELHAHKSFAIREGLEVNSWVRVKTGKLTIGSTAKPIVLFEQDINSLANLLPEKAFSKTEIEQFFAVTAPELDAILRLYFPDE